MDLKYECLAENYLGTDVIEVDICSKNADTKDQYYSRNTKKEIYLNPQIILKIDPNDTVYYSRYVNLTAKAAAEALEESRMRMLAASGSTHNTSFVSFAEYLFLYHAVLLLIQLIPI